MSLSSPAPSSAWVAGCPPETGSRLAETESLRRHGTVSEFERFRMLHQFYPREPTFMPVGYPRTSRIPGQFHPPDPASSLVSRRIRGQNGLYFAMLCSYRWLGGSTMAFQGPRRGRDAPPAPPQSPRSLLLDPGVCESLAGRRAAPRRPSCYLLPVRSPICYDPGRGSWTRQGRTSNTRCNGVQAL